MAPIIKVEPDIQTWRETAAEEITLALSTATAANRKVCAAISGGRTPLEVYDLLAQTPWFERIAWDRIHWLWVDERWVSPDHAESNYGTAWKVLFSRVNLPPGQVHRIPTENMTPVEAAAAYETELRELLGPSGCMLDLIVLGIGADGHTASLFPGSKESMETKRWVAATLSPSGIRQRITMTQPLLNAADTILFLVTGVDKRKVIDELLNHDGAARDYPAGRIRALRQTMWILDAAAAGKNIQPRSGEIS